MNMVKSIIISIAISEALRSSDPGISQPQSQQPTKESAIHGFMQLLPAVAVFAHY